MVDSRELDLREAVRARYKTDCVDVALGHERGGDICVLPQLAQDDSDPYHSALMRLSRSKRVVFSRNGKFIATDCEESVRDDDLNETVDRCAYNSFLTDVED